MRERDAERLHAKLSRRYPDGRVIVVPQSSGAVIVIETGSGTGRFTIGNGPSALLNYLVGDGDRSGHAEG